MRRLNVLIMLAVGASILGCAGLSTGYLCEAGPVFCSFRVAPYGSPLWP